MLLLDIPQFLSNHYETRSKWGTQKYLILTEFHNDWVKIVEFPIKAYFWFTVVFFATHLNIDLECVTKEFKTEEDPRCHKKLPKRNLNIVHIVKKLLVESMHCKIMMLTFNYILSQNKNLNIFVRTVENIGNLHQN